MERLTVNEAAKKLRISNEAVRKRVLRGTLPHGKRADGSVYVCLDPEEYKDEEEAPSAPWYATFWELAKENATLVGAIIALCGVLTTQILTANSAEQTRKQTAKLEDERARQTAELENQQAQENSLQTYLGDMGDLIQDRGLREAEPDSVISQLARAKTLTVTLTLNGERKSILLLFLNEQELINGRSKGGPVVSLEGADLSGADLSDIDLSYTNLAGANLSNTDLTDGSDYPDTNGTNISYSILGGVNFTGAELSGANLSGADLQNADLRGSVDLSDAKLRDANLSGANLSRSDLSGAILSSAILSRSDLSDANLSGAKLSGADLSGANLSGANVTQEQLQQAGSLDDALLPND
jgi:uncharacterized protein YjbI with pentapeptide repeats